MPRWEVALWCAFLAIQPPSVIFLISDMASAPGMPRSLFWWYIAIDAILVSLLAVRMAMTRTRIDQQPGTRSYLLMEESKKGK